MDQVEHVAGQLNVRLACGLGPLQTNNVGRSGRRLKLPFTAEVKQAQSYFSSTHNKDWSLLRYKDAGRTSEKT